MSGLEETLDDNNYDEFGLLHENAAEWDLPFSGRPNVARAEFALPSGDQLSYIRWGSAPPELVFLHGGGQNAHTWDTVILALGRPAVAVDLPGHGHSYRRPDRNYGPWRNAEAVAALIEDVAPDAAAVVGMSLGGATTTRLAATRPDRCRQAVIVDVTPQVNDPSRELTTMERGSVSLIGGPPTYESFEAMAEATLALSPLRDPAAVRRGVRHNARRLDDGSWTWRYDLFGGPPEEGPPSDEQRENWADFTPLWDDVSRITVPTLFVRGDLSPFVRDDDIEEMQRRLHAIQVVTVDGAGHAVQSDQPLVLVRLLEDFVFAGSRL
jgi:pimeloyl-ACP methyl ester carboxylesterase